MTLDIHKKLLKAVSEFEPVTFDKVNTHYKNGYATLSAIKKSIEPALHNNGFILMQPLEALDNGDIRLSTHVVYENGEKILLGSSIIKGGRKDQEFGGSVTYHRRYQIASGFCLFAEDDDDGEKAEGRVSPPEDYKPKPTKPIAPVEPEKAKAMTLTKAQIDSIKAQIKDYPEIVKDLLAFAGTKLVADIEYEKYQSCMNFISLRLKEEGVA
jgi:hypothetical protein